jgi:osmotically-inducible protein OsmY
MAKLVTKLAILLLIIATPVLLLAGSKKADNSLAEQIEHRLVGVAPNTVIIVVDEASKTAFLRGTVSSQAEIDRITDLVRSINDVRVIGSNLVVAHDPTEITRADDTMMKDVETLDTEEGTIHSGTTVITDASLRTAVEDALKSEGIMGQSKIKVETENGVVTLTGTALSEAHADRIVALAQSVPGVVSVEANIRLRDRQRPYTVKPSSERDKEGHEVGEAESRVDDEEDDEDEEEDEDEDEDEDRY